MSKTTTQITNQELHNLVEGLLAVGGIVLPNASIDDVIAISDMQVDLEKPYTSLQKSMQSIQEKHLKRDEKGDKIQGEQPNTYVLDDVVQYEKDLNDLLNKKIRVPISKISFDIFKGANGVTANVLSKLKTIRKV